MGLGWFIPRSPQTWKVATWVGGVLQLPLLRGYGDAWLFWAGGTRVYEPKSDAFPERRYLDPDSSPALPIFRTPNLAQLHHHLESAGCLIVRERSALLGKELIIQDQFGHLIGFREAQKNSDLSTDRIAKARTAGTRRFNPGVPPMPSAIDELDWICRHVADLGAMSAFYQQALGARLILQDETRALFDLGDGSCLELRAGGRSEPVPTDRFEVPDAFILRVSNFDTYRQRLNDNGAITVNDRIQFGRGALGYVADPEGHLIGFEERYDQARCPDDVVAFNEDLEANRRWRDLQEGKPEPSLDALQTEPLS